MDVCLSGLRVIPARLPPETRGARVGGSHGFESRPFRWSEVWGQPGASTPKPRGTGLTTRSTPGSLIREARDLPLRRTFLHDDKDCPT